MKYYSINLTEATLKKLLGQRSLFDTDEYAEIRTQLKYASDERDLENNRVSMVPIPKGTTATPSFLEGITE